jgi:septation ring formation regulator EzrA
MPLTTRASICPRAEVSRSREARQIERSGQRLPAAMMRAVAYSARERREAMHHLADLRRRLAEAEDALVEAQAARKRGETTFDAASDRFAAVEQALDAARDEQARARQERYAARQAHAQAEVTMKRLQRGIDELAERLDRDT